MQYTDQELIELILEQLTQAEDGELITYSQLSALTGVDVQFEHRRLLDAALKKALYDHSIVFENERNIGYRRWSDPEIIIRLREMQRIRNATKKGRDKLSTVDFDKLDNAIKPLHNSKFLILTVVDNMATEKAAKRISVTIDREMELQLNVKKALEVRNQSKYSNRTCNG